MRELKVRREIVPQDRSAVKDLFEILRREVLVGRLRVIREMRSE